MLEYIAVGFSLLYVLLTIYRNIWCWPIGILGILAYSVVFWQSQLYVALALQGVYLVQSVYGWWLWNKASHAMEGETDSNRVIRLPVSWYLPGILGTLALAAILGWIFQHTDDPYPYLDALCAAISVTALLFTAKKILENWPIWVLADAVYVWVM